MRTESGLIDCSTCQKDGDGVESCQEFEKKFENEIVGYWEKKNGLDRCWHPRGSIFIWGEEEVV
jgi:hypothetical protein